jgi:hypothetical protein
MPKIKLTDEQAEELKDVLKDALKATVNWHYEIDMSNADHLAAYHRLSVLNDILDLLEIA